MLWTKSMECGIPLIDRQHKELFDQVAMLLTSEKQERILDIIKFLERYVVEHFKTEEVMHSRSGYPQAAIHRKMHRDFTAAFLELKREYEESGYNLKTLLKINGSVAGWLKEHVLGADLDFAKYHCTPAVP